MPKQTKQQTRTAVRTAPARAVTIQSKANSQYRRVGGNGAYTVQNGPWANRGANIGRAIGTLYGGNIGGAAGEWIGRRAFHYPARLFGSGSYTMTHDASERIAPQVPMFTTGSGDDSVVIAHREYLGDITTSDTVGGFKINSYGINPSMNNSFPWLSNIAAPNYQQYKFEGLVFEFRSFSADALNSTNTALGSVFACINYDYTDADLSSRYEVENTDWASSCKPSENMIIPVECKPRQTSMNGLLYVLNGSSIPPGADPKTFFLGKLWFGTTGFQGTNVNIGSLYVTYKVRLYKPLMTKPLSNGLLYIGSRSNCDNTNRLGTANTVTTLPRTDNIGVTFTNNTFTLNNQGLVIGQLFQCQCVWKGVSAVANVSRCVLLPTVSSAIDFVNYGQGGTASFDESPNDGVNTGLKTVMVSLYFRIKDNTSPITFSASGGNVSGLSTLDFKLLQINGTPANDIGNTPAY